MIFAIVVGFLNFRNNLHYQRITFIFVQNTFTMKNLAIFVLLFSIFVSCGKDDDDTPPQSSGNNQPSNPTDSSNGQGNQDTSTAQTFLANFNVDRNYIQSGERITITDNSEGAVQYEWDFGNGESSQIKNPTVIYENNGEYDVRLTIYNSNNQTKTVSKKVVVGDKIFKQIKLTAFPEFDSNGSLWDGGFFGNNSGPDIEVDILNGGSDFSTATINDVEEEDLPIVWNVLSEDIKLGTSTWKLEFEDEDDVRDESMFSVDYNVENIAGYYETGVVTSRTESSDGEIGVELTFQIVP